jgi:hypothetical protein
MTTFGHWPATMAVNLDDVLVDPDRLLTAAEETVRDLEVRQPVRLGVDPAFDARWLRFLGMATARYQPLRWRLTGELPWPVRAVVHYAPPAAADAEGVDQWQAQHGVALCTYRCGPGFVALRDRRPGGQSIRAMLADRWVEPFHALLDRPADTPDTHQLLDELTAAGLALRLGADQHVVLAQRLSRWPVPFTAA